MLRRLFDASFRKARALEAQGDHRGAAILYAEAGADDEAAAALLFAAARTVNAKEREETFVSALRFLAPTDPRVRDAELGAARAVDEDLPAGSTLLAEDRARLRNAALLLEKHDDQARAKAAFERAGDSEGVARCLAKLGDVDQLESVLSVDVAKSSSERTVQRLISAYEEAMKLGARSDARDALVRAREASPGNRSVDELLAQLDARFPSLGVVTLRVGDARCTFVGKPAMTLGRDADLSVRGTSVSRSHAEVSLGDTGGIALRDLGSRNGTLIAGVPIAGTAQLSAEVELGLGDDVHVRVVRDGDRLVATVSDGPDRDARGLAGEGALAVPGARAAIRFERDRATLVPADGSALWLSGVRVTMPVVLLLKDSLDVDGVRIEVIA